MVRPEALLLAGGLLAVPALILAIEGGLAVLHAGEFTDQESTSIDRLHRYSEVYGWEPRPGQYVEEGKRITINAAGYRGEALPAEPAPSRRRVVIVGDSVAFGLYVGDRETYASRLDAGSDAVEVANLAVQGYGPGQSLLRLERVGLPLRPDLVVYAMCLGNDVADAMLENFLFDPSHPVPYFRIEAGALVLHDEDLKLGARRRLSLWLQDNSRLFRAMAPTPQVSKQKTEAEANEAWTTRRREALRDRPKALELVSRIVAEMRDRSEAQGARFLVLLHPERVGGGRAAERWERALRDRLDAAGVASLSLEEAYEAQGLRVESITIDGIGHLSVRGHEITAGILAGALPGGAAAAASTDRPFRPRL
jgi:hypothetical protein